MELSLKNCIGDIKPFSYFYPPSARENMTPEEMGELEHELLMHFIAIRGEELQKLAIDLVKVIEKFGPMELVINQAPIIQERLKREMPAKEQQNNDQQMLEEENK